MSDLAAFGYTDRTVVTPASVQASDAIHPDTLEPAVAIFFRPDLNAEQVGFALPVDFAEQFAGEILEAARRARAKSLHPPTA